MFLNFFSKKRKWYEPKDPTPREQCPCCDHFSLPERESYLICKVCFWEDDGQDVDEIDVCRGGPNGSLTLRQARENFKKFGASEERLISHVCSQAERSKYKYIKREI